MKALSKPLSSPGRADKFPPPLMRFLRSNVGSRSRGRSKSSPMFYLRSKKRVPEPTQEPSSPKVTCIGQVRVRRSAKSKPPAAAAVKRRRCWWLKKALFCGQKKPYVRKLFCRCGSFFRGGYCKRVDDREDSFGVYSNKKDEKNVASNCCSNDSETDSRSGPQENKREFIESSPPKNALLLTRCRSAPYRSSSLAGRFWGSGEEKDSEKIENGGKSEDLPENVEHDEEEESSEENSLKKKNEEMKVLIGGGAVHPHPLLLTRCKSEPATTGERLSAEAILLRQDVVQPRSQQNS